MALCDCGHERAVHEHWRVGYCGSCGCNRYRRSLRSRIRQWAAVVGIGVIAAGAALTIGLGSGQQAHADNTFGGAGQTSVQTTPPSTPSIPSAAPTLKAAPFAGGEGNHG
jgi:hypothetical protein